MQTKVVKYANSRKLRKGETFLSKVPSKCQKDGWLSTEQYLPEDYELVHLKSDLLGSAIPGWAQGNKFVGLRVKDQPYKYWKFARGENE